MIILAKTKISIALKEHPELKKVLMSMSPKFSKLENTKIFGIVSKWATFNDVAKVGKISICELLHTLNNEIGNEDKLYLSFPECIKELEKETKSVKPQWVDKIKQLVIFDVRDLDSFFLPQIIEKQRKLKKDQALQVINDFDPVPLKRMLEENGDTFYSEELKNGEFHLFIKYKKAEKLTNENWKDNIEQFEEINAIGMKEDPFEMIVKKAQSLEQGEGFVLKQMFEPIPLINMLTGMGFEYFTEQKETFRFLIYFFKTVTKDDESKKQTDKVSVIIQSATPITYPIIMKMLQSKRLMDKIEIKELKVWEETEKHMAWVMNKKADITFSAVAAAAKLYLSGVDIKMYSINIWDNFHLLTRGYDAKNFADLKGHKIHVPLFKQAPPMVMTKHLIEANGYNTDDFEFTFGDPFGRPEEIKNDFIAEKSDTVLLREPEASYAMYNAKNAYESISYSKLWKEDGNKIGNIPNAGLIFKGDFLREHPDVAKIFVEELEKATEWVVENKKAAAEMAFDIMKHKPEEVELFLNRAHFEHVKSDKILDEIVHYLQVLNDGEKYTKNNLKGLFQVNFSELLN
ncbi:MAG: DUF2249 domain-containing protein [Candidatus Cloacimonadota bacterium]|nr:DUF2249 domain-containing protein [Candidatus Cloacimonadota bacterium]